MLESELTHAEARCDQAFAIIADAIDLLDGNMPLNEADQDNELLRKMVMHLEAMDDKVKLRRERDEAIKSADSAWANRDVFCHHINIIAKEVLGWVHDNSSPEAVSREIIALTTGKLEKIDAITKERDEARAEITTAKQEVLGLVTSIWKKEHQSEAPHWQPLPDLQGLISQLDNMYAGMRTQRDQANWDLCKARAEVERLREAFKDAQKKWYAFLEPAKQIKSSGGQTLGSESYRLDYTGNATATINDIFQEAGCGAQ